MNAPFAPVRMQARLSADDVFALMEAGVIYEGARFELLDGEIIPVSPADLRHQDLLRFLEDGLAPLRDIFWVTGGATLKLNEYSLVDPDIAVSPKHVKPLAFPNDQVALAVEIAVTSPRYDLGQKARSYAVAGVQELWVVDPAKRLTHVHRTPSNGFWCSVEQIPFDGPLSPAVRPSLAITIG